MCWWRWTSRGWRWWSGRGGGGGLGRGRGRGWGGGAAVFETATGKMLWRAQTAVGNVQDIDVGGGAVAIGGAAVPAQGEEGAGIAMTPLAVALEARTGQVMHKLEDLGGQQVRWVRL